jgi:hypothetical protein
MMPRSWRENTLRSLVYHIGGLLVFLFAALRTLRKIAFQFHRYDISSKVDETTREIFGVLASSTRAFSGSPRCLQPHALR